MRVYSKYRNKYVVYRVYEVFGDLLICCRQDPCSVITTIRLSAMGKFTSKSSFQITTIPQLRLSAMEKLTSRSSFLSTTIPQLRLSAMETFTSRSSFQITTIPQLMLSTMGEFALSNYQGTIKRGCINKLI